MSIVFTLSAVFCHTIQKSGVKSMQNAQVANTIKLLCKQQQITINSLIQSCNLTKSLIYDMEKRDKTPSADKIEKIADYLGCSVDYLLGRTDNPEINK